MKNKKQVPEFVLNLLLKLRFFFLFLVYGHVDVICFPGGIWQETCCSKYHYGQEELIHFSGV